MRILITGSRDWRDYQTIFLALEDFSGYALDSPEKVVVVHGGATGADHMANSAAVALGFTPEPHFPNYHDLSPQSAPLMRNKLMVDLGADVCLAFPTPSSRGTYHCARLAEEAGIPVKWYGPWPVSSF